MENLRLDEKYIIKKLRFIATSRSLVSLIFKVLIFGVGLYLVFTRVFGFAVTSGLSMYPRLSDSDLVLYYRLDEKIKVDDIVVFNQNDKQYILRVVGTSGQTIDIDKDGNLIRDGHVVDEKVVYKTYKDKNSNISFPFIVPDGEYFVLGDFRMSSVDSRNFGSIKREQIKGSVINLLRSRDL
jgi:signal peptidase I